MTDTPHHRNLAETEILPVHDGAATHGDIRQEPLDCLADYWKDPTHTLAWTCPFVLPPWLNAWWPLADADWSPYILSVRHQGAVAGIAPLMRRGQQARLIGDAEVCDHLDVVAAPQHVDTFCQLLLAQLARDGVKQLVLSPVRQDSLVMTHLMPVARRQGAQIVSQRQAQLLAMPLPDSWEVYLQNLRGKDRHEIRRKLRRLNEAGRVTLRRVNQAAQVTAAMQIFLRLFRANRSDKAAFMTEAMTDFFHRLAANLAASDLLRLYFLDLDGQPIAATMCIEHRSTVYLYNNGYDAAYQALSVGLLSKALTIKASIRDGCQVYDFLKGSEVYKKRLGGKPVNIHRCILDLD
jgi:CelD/BcsL family acetyltransferase involved in cellulose biosynthesis